MTSSLVLLRGGLVLPAEPILLLLDLERRGITVEVDETDLLVSPRQLLTDQDRAALRRWSLYVRKIVAYHTEVVM